MKHPTPAVARGGLAVLALLAALTWEAAAARAAPPPPRPGPIPAQLADLAREVSRQGCAGAEGTGGGEPFRWAALGCQAFTAGALVAAAVAPGAPPAERARAGELVEQLARLALGPAAQAPFTGTGTVTAGRRDVPASVLYRGLALYVLAGLERLEGPNPLSGELDALAAGLAADLERSRSGLLPTYGTTDLYPSDHAPAAAALLLHGRLRGSAASTRAGAALTARLLWLLHRRGGFPTRVTPPGATAVGVRGTPLAFTASFLLAAEPAAARRRERAARRGLRRRRDRARHRRDPRPRRSRVDHGARAHGGRVGPHAR
ncbi:MAG TPA: hypothetical protein VGQ83_38010, partial [Polyangia bacterium]